PVCIAACATMLAIVCFLSACSTQEQAKNAAPKIGVSFGVGEASRWQNELEYMEERAAELGVGIETRLNKTDEPKTQTEDCKELIDSGIDVLIVTPRNVDDMGEVISYAKEHRVKVVNYARLITNQDLDLFVGYDSGRIGQILGQYLSVTVYTGDYLLLQGDPGDFNAALLYEGAMRYIEPLDDINIIADKAVTKWSADEAKQITLDAVTANGNKVDAILAPNDKIAGACRAALDELDLTAPVVITGMDAELDAVRRIAVGTQNVTMYMNLEELANTAVNEAVNLAKDDPVNVNTKFDNGTEGGVDSNLITGKLVTKENIDTILIDSGYYTKEQVYGESPVS
ncbi:MAG: substrate-binding domain-containing protein, partial [Gordonibacter sp.]|uniref:sugar ABC transporter substrate-binding protein n=1 Tax=Gordonibacter sp. TaxID=1968902 RepID=UPI002FCB57D4